MRIIKTMRSSKNTIEKNNNKTTQMFYLEPYLTKSNMYKKIYIHDYLCEIYNFSFTAETVFLSFFLGPFVFLLFT